MSDARFRQRLAAILAADVVGYSKLMSDDERATVLALDTGRSVFKAAIESNQGRVIDMAGDSVLAVFETAVGAVSAALAIQTAINDSGNVHDDLRRMRYRIGVHLGDVIEKADGTIYGDGVNIAARLEGLADPGGVTVSDVVYGAVRGKVKANFIDQGEQQVKNIAYPVRHYRIELAQGAATERPAMPGQAQLPLPPGDSNPFSIVVLPFLNMSGDPEQEYLADGITEDLTIDLSRIAGSFVIARSSAFTYKGKTVVAMQLGRELGVRYVLEGSVRRAGNRVRVNAQLIDAENGAHVWADRFDRELVDVLDLYNGVTSAIARALRYELIEAETRRSMRERPGNPQAIDCVLREAALWLRNPSPTHEIVKECRGLLERALELDPTMLAALTGLAQLKVNEANTQRSSDPAATLKEIEALVARAEAIAPHDARVLQARGNTFMLRRQPELALPFLEAARARDPNSTQILRNLGWCTLFLGEPAQAIVHLEQSLRLDPRGQGRGSVHGATGVANLYLGNYDEAIRLTQMCCAELPDLAFARFVLASACALAGRIEEAGVALQEFQRLRPGVDIAQLRSEAISSNSKYLALRERLYDGLRLAGMAT